MFIPLLFLLEAIYKVLATITLPDKGIFPLEKKSVGLQFYVDVENLDRLMPCKVHTWAKKCCLLDKDPDCSMMVYGENIDTVRPNDRKTYVFVYPTVFQHDKTGFCDFILDYKCGQMFVKRELFNITFDTRPQKLTKTNVMKRYVRDAQVTDCETIDADSLNDCAQVDCNVKYSDEKPYFDRRLKKCVEAVSCLGDPKSEFPQSAYLPDVNFCRDLDHTFEIQDIYAIANGYTVTTDIPVTETVFNAVVKSNCSTISQNLCLISDLLSGKLCPFANGVYMDVGGPCKKAAIAISRWIVGISLFIIAFVIFTVLSGKTLKKWKDGTIQKQYTNLVNTCNGRKTQSETRIVEHEPPKINPRVKNALIREVFQRGMPFEIRGSVVDVCDRVGREVRWKKRYRVADMIEKPGLDRLQTTSTTSTESSLNNSEVERLMK